MNKYEKHVEEFKEEFKKLTEKAQETNEPVFTASQKKRKKLHPWQIDITESLKFAEATDFFFSLTKKRAKKGETTIKLINNNPSGLRSLFKNK